MSASGDGDSCTALKLSKTPAATALQKTAKAHRDRPVHPELRGESCEAQPEVPLPSLGHHAAAASGDSLAKYGVGGNYLEASSVTLGACLGDADSKEGGSLEPPVRGSLHEEGCLALQEEMQMVNKDVPMKNEIQALKKENSVVKEEDQVVKDDSLMKDNDSLVNKEFWHDVEEDSWNERVLVDTKQYLPAKGEIVIDKKEVLERKYGILIAKEEAPSVCKDPEKNEAVYVENFIEGADIPNKELKITNKPKSVITASGQTKELRNDVKQKGKGSSKKPDAELNKRVSPAKKNQVSIGNEKEAVVNLLEPEAFNREQKKKMAVKNPVNVVKDASQEKFNKEDYTRDKQRSKRRKRKSAKKKANSAEEKPKVESVKKKVTANSAKEKPKVEVREGNDRQPEDAVEVTTVVKVVVKPVVKNTSESKAAQPAKEILKKQESEMSNDGKTSKVVVETEAKRFVILSKSGGEAEVEIHNTASPAPHNPQNDSDSDNDGIIVTIPSIAEQRKFAEVASHITRLQKFQAAMDKVDLGAALWKGYVLDYTQAWASAWTCAQQQCGVLGSDWQYGGQGRGRNVARGRATHIGSGQELEINQGRDDHTGRGRGVTMDQGRVTAVPRGRGMNVAPGRGMEGVRDRGMNISGTQGTEACRGRGFGGGRGTEIRRGL